MPMQNTEMVYQRGCQRPRKAPKWCVRESQSLCILKAFSEIAN